MATLGTKIVKLKYKSHKLTLMFCNSNFDYYVTQYRGNLVICINRKLNRKEQSRILHKVIKEDKNSGFKSRVFYRQKYVKNSFQKFIF